VCTLVTFICANLSWEMKQNDYFLQYPNKHVKSRERTILKNGYVTFFEMSFVSALTVVCAYFKIYMQFDGVDYWCFFF